MPIFGRELSICFRRVYCLCLGNDGTNCGLGARLDVTRIGCEYFSRSKCDDRERTSAQTSGSWRNLQPLCLRSRHGLQRPRSLRITLGHCYGTKQGFIHKNLCEVCVPPTT